jgi:hypothetical protein
MIRKCNLCDNHLNGEGYVIDDGTEYYCSEKCLHERVGKEDYLELYNEGLAYWTTFEEEEENE